jgi:DNA invertase Pin-like site-specific DNA recombinase
MATPSKIGPAQKKAFRCAVYTRVSTDDQARGDYSSLKSQKDICEHYVSIHQMDGWAVTHYFEDPGYSGKDMSRPGIQALLSEVRAKNVDVVVAYKIDRISRHLPDFYDFWRVLERHGVNFVSATQNFDTGTPMGMLMLNMLLSFGQFEREMTVERTVHKLTERAKHGKWNGGWVPIGYEYDKITQRLKPHPEEADLVKQMYQLAKQLKNVTEIANVLNQTGKRTRQRVLVRRDGTQKVVGEKRFIGDRVGAIIANPIYKGVIKHHDAEYASEHPALVSPKLWEDANAALLNMKGGRARLQRRDKHVHILKGLLKCGHCGTALTPYPAGKKDKDGQPYLYYTCTHVTKDGSAAQCPVRHVPARAFEDLIIGYLGEIGRHPEVISAAVQASNQAKQKAVRPLRSKLAGLEKCHRELSEAMRNCIETVKKRGASKITDDFMVEAERLAAEKRHIELEKEKLKIDIDYQERTVADEQVIADALLRFEQVIKNLPPVDQKELIRLIVREISVKHFDPDRNEMPRGQGVFSTKIRTKWYLVNISLFASDLLAGVSPDGKISSDFGGIGSPGRTRTYNLVINSHSLHH